MVIYKNKKTNTLNIGKLKLHAKYFPWVVEGVDTATFLLGYEMETVSFTEFIYYEAVRWGIKLLKQAKNKKDPILREYMAMKFITGIWSHAYYFHLTYGPLNPFSVKGYDAMYQYYWNEYLEVAGQYSWVPSGFSHDFMTQFYKILQVSEGALDATSVFGSFGAM